MRHAGDYVPRYEPPETYRETDPIRFDPDAAMAVVSPGWAFLRADQLRRLLAAYPMGRRDILALAIKRNRPELSEAVDDTLTVLFAKKIYE